MVGREKNDPHSCDDIFGDSSINRVEFVFQFVFMHILKVGKGSKKNALLNELLGKPPPSKTDEFSEKFQTAFDPPPLIFGKSCCRFFKQLYSLKNHTCGIFLKSPGYESIKNNDPCCQIQSYFF